MSIDVSLSGRVKVSFSVNFCIVAIKILKEVHGIEDQFFLISKKFKLTWKETMVAV